MNIGDIILIAGLIGGGILAGVWLWKWLGLTEALQAILQFFTGAMTFIAGMINAAPKFVKMLIFLLGGIAVLGLITNWFVASDIVCLKDKPYRSESLVEGVYAKFLSVEIDQERLEDGTYMAKFGNLYEVRNGVRTFLIPDDTVFDEVAEVSRAESDGSVGYPSVSFKIYKEGLLGSGPCYVGTCSAFDLTCSRVGELIYATDGYNWRVHAMGSVTFLGVGSYLTGDECSGSVGEQAVINESDVAFGWGYNMGEVTTYTYDADHSFYVQNLTRVEESEVLDKLGKWLRQSKRERYMTNSSFYRVNATANDFISYGCDAQQDVRVLLYGVDIFRWETLAIIMFLGALFWVMKWM